VPPLAGLVERIGEGKQAFPRAIVHFLRPGGDIPTLYPGNGPRPSRSLTS